MNSENVRKSLQAFINKFESELHLTPMHLRSSYATIMMRLHATRKESNYSESFQNLSEDEFLTMLSCVMNTNVEQLRGVYAAASHATHANRVARMMQICDDSGAASGDSLL